MSPSHTLIDGSVRLEGVGPDNPVIYDNDWWFDVFDNNYLWAQASMGKVNLRGNIVSRDMWDWEKGYHYSFEQSWQDAEKARKLARGSGLKNIPDLTRGADRVLMRPESGRIEDTVPHPSDGSRLIVAEAKRASPEKPLLVISGGPLTTVANALVTNPEIAPNLVVFNLTVSDYGYNGKDGWAAYIVAKRTRYVDWGDGQFWDRDSVFTAKDFEPLPDNPFTLDMKRFIKTDLGRANQLGDGAPLVWLFQPKCWTGAEVRRADFQGRALVFRPAPSGDKGDVLVIPKSATDLKACRDEFFRVLVNPVVYGGTAEPLKMISGLSVQVLGKEFRPDPARVVVQQTEIDRVGNTSVRNTDRAHLEWKTKGYFQRNRDLGQVFTAPRDFQLAAIVLRTGPADAAVLAGTPGAKVFAQFFEVTGKPRIHDNGTPPGTEATHGFSKNHRCDDYLTGVNYRPLVVVQGGVFPQVPPTRDDRGKALAHDAGRLVYLRWAFAPEARLRCQAGRRYAFMVGCTEPGTERGSTLANANLASATSPPSLTDRHDPYHGGWGLRREGDGTLPPTMLPGAQPPADAALLERLFREALFADGSARYLLSPTTDGFPDVDTYRDLEFYLEAASTP
ncbi:MAG TPA: hypothetical protein VI136_00405 [Verrucomicrobiae bacterium]